MTDHHDETATHELRERWARTLRAVTADAGVDPYPYADNLLARWSEPQRKYHTVAHLTAVLDHIDVLEEHAEEPELVRLAAWFHDAVYRPDRSENEERSAALAERALAEAGLAADAVAEVARLVRLTVGHDPSDDDTHGEALCDADLDAVESVTGVDRLEEFQFLVDLDDLGVLDADVGVLEERPLRLVTEDADEGQCRGEPVVAELGGGRLVLEVRFVVLDRDGVLANFLASDLVVFGIAVVHPDNVRRQSHVLGATATLCAPGGCRSWGRTS